MPSVVTEPDKYSTTPVVDARRRVIGDKSREVGELRAGSDEILNAYSASGHLSRLFLFPQHIVINNRSAKITILFDRVGVWGNLKKSRKNGLK